jgi:hypothetical protein
MMTKNRFKDEARRIRRKGRLARAYGAGVGTMCHLSETVCGIVLTPGAFGGILVMREDAPKTAQSALSVWMLSQGCRPNKGWRRAAVTASSSLPALPIPT